MATGMPPTSDFFDFAAPLLSQLEDDPRHAAPEDPHDPTTFPGQISIEGQPTPLVDDGESIDPVGANSPVSDEDAAAARSAYPMAGIDVLAFYKSFRFRSSAPFPGHWGVFLLDAGVAALTAEFCTFAPRLPAVELRQLAVDLLVAHERYHFWTDAWALGQEVTPLVTPEYKRYVPYLAGKKQVELTPDDYEESLANHYAFRRLKRRVLSDGSPASAMLRHVLGLAPIPYSTYSFDKRERAEREGILALSVANGMHPGEARNTALMKNIEPSILSASLHPPERWHPTAGTAACPVYYVHTFNYASLVQPFQGPDLTEFRRYVCGYLDGSFLERTDHDYYRIDNGEKVKVPNPHGKTVRGYELKGTLHKAGMTHKEFQHERQRTKSWTRHCPRPEPKPPRIDD